MNGSRNKGGSWIKCSVELNRNIWYIFQEHEKHEPTTLGIQSGIHPGDIEKLEAAKRKVPIKNTESNC